MSHSNISNTLIKKQQTGSEPPVRASVRRRQVGVRLDVHLYKRIKKIAFDTDVSVQSVIERALRDYDRQHGG